MAWLYLPSMESLSFRESQDLTSALNTSSQTQEPFVMSRGKRMRLKSFMRKCSKENYLMPRYIPMCEPFHPLLITSLKKWISLQQDSHVSHSVPPVLEREPMTKDGYGLQSLKSLGKLDRPSYSWKTFQTSLMNGGHLTRFQSPWPKSGSILNGVLYERPMLGPIIKETVYSSLDGKTEVYPKSLFPTPTANDGHNHTLPKSQSKRDSLVGKIMNFPTPTASDGKRTSKKYGGGNLTLFGKVSLLPTPTTTGNQLCPSEMKKGSSFKNLKAISTLHGGEGNRLSPLFVEWMMGFPTGWTDLER